jgi:antitoxin HigA-1
MRMFNPLHPGLVLREYLGELSVLTAATHLQVSRVTLSRVLNGRAGVSADLALRLADALGKSPEPWAGMQSQYDLWVASRRRRKKVMRLHGVLKRARSA